MGEILMKIVGFIVDVFFLLGLIWLIVLTLVIILRVNFGRLLWLGFGVGSYTIKGRITFNDKSEAQPQVNICSDPMKRPPRKSHYSKPVKPKKHKPEWWRFLT